MSGNTVVKFYGFSSSSRKSGICVADVEKSLSWWYLKHTTRPSK